MANATECLIQQSRKYSALITKTNRITERNVGVINGRMGQLFGQEMNGKQGRNRQTNKCQRRSCSPKRQANQTRLKYGQT